MHQEYTRTSLGACRYRRFIVVTFPTTTVHPSVPIYFTVEFHREREPGNHNSLHRPRIAEGTWAYWLGVTPKSDSTSHK